MAFAKPSSPSNVQPAAPGAAPGAAGAAPAPKGKFGGGRPAKSLSMLPAECKDKPKEALVNEDYCSLCGLFPAADTKGNGFFKGTERESGRKFFMQKNKDGSAWELTYADAVADENTKRIFVRLGTLEEVTKKDGSKFFVCEDKEGNKFYIRDVKPLPKK